MTADTARETQTMMDDHASLIVPPPTRSKPNGHPADGMTMHMPVGDGAVMSIADPRSFDDGGAEWVMRYGNPESIRYAVASLLSSYDYLLSAHITMAEATRRLRILRRYRTAALKARAAQEQKP